MTKDEKILQKVGKLLLKFGVADDEKEEFISQLSAMKEDDEEPTEPTEPNGEPTKEGEQPDEVKEPEGEEGQKVEGEQPEVEEPEVEEPKEEVTEEGEKPDEQPQNEEVQKTIEGLVARINAQEKQLIDLQEIVAKLGDPKENGFGTSPSNPSGGSAEQSEFDRINRARLGR